MIQPLLHLVSHSHGDNGQPSTGSALDRAAAAAPKKEKEEKEEEKEEKEEQEEEEEEETL